VTPGPAFCVREVPFSTFGSWLDLSRVTGEGTVADDVHLVSHQTGFHPVLRLVPRTAGERAGTTVTATPSRLTWTAPGGRIEAAFASPDTVHLRGQGLGLAVVAADHRLTPFSGAYLVPDPPGEAHVLTSYQTGRRYRLTVLPGPDGARAGVRVTGAQAVGAAERALHLGEDGDPWHLAIEETDTARPPYRPATTFEEVVAASDAAFGAFVDAVAPWRDRETPAAALAAYVLWSATVRPAGFVTRPAVLMSKHWMDKVWSWDHCFTALALAGLPELAWDQFEVPFDHQDGAGALPDSVAHSEVLRNFVKPPIHGWALHHLRRRTPAPDRDRLAAVYDRLGRWTRFWLDHRRAGGALAHYQHGNDSGWDNATTFDPERLVETADLGAFLVLQLRQLADLAVTLDRPDDAATWTAAARRMLDAVLRELWTGERFRARGVVSGRTWTGASLLDLMPIVLGEQLPPPVAARLAAGIEGHLTEHGLATERPSSPRYAADGYWRGPIWAPATVLVEDGLRRAGHAGLADRIGRQFLDLCERSGFAENFDALTGTGQRDLAYTWTAAGYLMLAGAAVHRRAAGGPTAG